MATGIACNAVGAGKPTTLRLTAEQLVAASCCKHETCTQEKRIVALIGGTLGGLTSQGFQSAELITVATQLG